MARLQSFAATLLVLAVVFQAASAQTCQLTAADVRTGDYSQVATKCRNLASPPSASQCNTCGCALADAFAPVLRRAGVNLEGVDRSTATDAITACINVIYGPLSSAGVDVVGLSSLQNCATVPSCLTAAAPSPSG